VQPDGALHEAQRLVGAAAGAQVLRGGGNAADAAVATALALSVVDPANCGIGGYGGFAVVAPRGARPRQIAFNAAVPAGVRGGAVTRRGAGSRVTPPAVVPGLRALHATFGRLDAHAVFAPAIALATRGFAVTRGLAAALLFARDNHRGLNDAFRRTFFRDDSPLREGETLKQPALAATLATVAREGDEALRTGALPAALLRTVNGAGGELVADDFVAIRADVADAAHGRYQDADVFASDPDGCGASILLPALRTLDGVALGSNRGDRYVDAVGNALIAAWRRRDAIYAPLSRASSQTTHLCAADAGGLLVSMTFTHGPVWFGSGLLDEATGILLNCGMHILARRRDDGTVVAQPHLTPAIVRRGDVGYAIGSPGGRRIPAIVLQAIVDLVHYGTPVERLLDAPRLSANGDCSLEAEAALADAMPGQPMRVVEPHEYFGPAGALSWSGDGVRCAVDPRFADASARVA
jgi:gamma-glutamyltranspeptidase/glutathione hydrolase